MYDGTNYHGWQVQKSEKTVCGTLETALSAICGHTVKVTGCGRTDAGVHALRYCANFRTDSAIPAERFPYAVNSRLPADISVTAATDAADDFNAILSCEKKEYIYKIYASRIRDPFWTDRACFYPGRTDVAAMKAAAAYFIGTHDFAAVRSVGTETRSTVRTVYWYEIEQSGPLISLRVCADGFLYNMARAMAGTLLYVSEKKLRPEDIPELLERRDRRCAGPTMPPQGLYLNRIWYEGEVGRMMSD